MFEEVKKVKKGFWVDPQKWEDFKAISKLNNSDSNKMLRIFIDKYLEENRQLTIQIRSRTK